VLLLNECLLLFISLSTQSGNFWIHPRRDVGEMKSPAVFVEARMTTSLGVYDLSSTLGKRFSCWFVVHLTVANSSALYMSSGLLIVPGFSVIYLNEGRHSVSSCLSHCSEPVKGLLFSRLLLGYAFGILWACRILPFFFIYWEVVFRCIWFCRSDLPDSISKPQNSSP
jgi:hypothetical protein